MFGVGLVVSILPHKFIILSGSATGVGWLAAAFALAFVPIQLPLGRWADRLGFRLFLTVGCLICAGAGLVYYMADALALLLVGRFLQGLGEIPIWSMAPALLTRENPKKRGRYIGRYNAAIHIGLTAGCLAGFTGIFQGNTPFLIYSGVGFLAALGMGLAPRSAPHSIKQAPELNTPVLLQWKGVVTITLAGIILYGAGYGIFLSNLPGYLMDVEGWSPNSIPLVLTIFYMGIGISQILAGRLSDAKGPLPVMTAGLSMAALGFFLLPLVDPKGSLVLLGMAALGLGSFCVAALVQLTLALPRIGEGQLAGYFYCFWGIGSFCIPLLLGKIWAPEHWQKGFNILACLWILIALCCLVENQATHKASPRKIRIKQ